MREELLAGRTGRSLRSTSLITLNPSGFGEALRCVVTPPRAMSATLEAIGPHLTLKQMLEVLARNRERLLSSIATSEDHAIVASAERMLKTGELLEAAINETLRKLS